MKSPHACVTAVFVLFVVAAPLHAQDARTAPGQSSSGADSKGKGSARVSREDREFMETVARDNLAEIEAGKLAQQKASDDRVRELGRMMERDRRKADQALRKIAAAKGVDLPMSPDRGQQQTLKDLESKTGTDFEKAFAAEAAKDHARAQKLFDKARKESRDEDVRAFAGTTIAAITEHLHTAHEISGEKKSGGGSGKGAARKGSSAK